MNFEIPLCLVYCMLEKTVDQLNPLQANLLTGVSKLEAIKALKISQVHKINSFTDEHLNNSERLRRTIFPLQNFGRFREDLWAYRLHQIFGDNYKILVTVLTILVFNIQYLFSLASGTNIHKMSSTSKISHQHPKIVNKLKSPTSRWHELHCHRLTSYKTNLARRTLFELNQRVMIPRSNKVTSGSFERQNEVF